MSKLSRYLFLVILIGLFTMLGCGVSSGGASAAAANTYQVVTVSDLHFNPLYDTTLYSQLAAAAPSGWEKIYTTSKVKIPSTGGSDTNFPLLLLTLASMKQNMSNSPVVLFTGDLLGHNIPQNFYPLYYGKTDYGTPSKAATAALDLFIVKTFAFVAGMIRVTVGKPVIYVPGNIDAYQGNVGPEPQFLADNALTVYSLFLHGSIDQKAFLSTFTSGGYYAIQPLGANLLVIGLNTNAFMVGAPDNGVAAAELTWLNLQLSAAQAAGQKVWILMHVPPGANSQSIAQVAPTPGDVNEETAAMMWNPGPQSAFLETLSNYPGLVTLMLAGHTHMDEFRLLPSGNVLEQLPGISPCFGNNPAYKVLTITQNTFTPTDYQSFNYNLAVMPSQFGALYQFSTTYGATSNLGYSLQLLYPQLNGSQSQRQMYTFLYTSGSTAVNPITFAPWNPINNVNWPIFSCTVSKIDQPGYLNCVNTY
jgi:sphingomyelin phosphodiesterase acid-like 3